MIKVVLFFSAMFIAGLVSAQTTINVSFNKPDYCIGDSLVATISFSRPSNAHYTGFYGITGNIISGYSDYSQYHQCPVKNSKSSLKYLISLGFELHKYGDDLKQILNLQPIFGYESGQIRFYSNLILSSSKSFRPNC